MKNGKWTYDAFWKYIENAAQDLNGDGNITYDSDFIPFTYTAISTEGFYLAGGNSFCNVENGKISVDILSDRASSAIETLKKLFDSDGVSLNGQAEDKDGKTAKMVKQYFGDCRGLFLGSSMDTINTFGRSMKDDFTIVPCPKYEESQTGYVSSINPWVNCAVMVPKSGKDLELTGLVMQTLAAYGYENLRPAVYDTMMKNKVARNDESIEMLDLIYSNVTVDVNTIYNFGNTSWVIQAYIRGEIENYASGFASNKKAAEKEIDKFVELFED